jgi:ribonuclease HII
MGLMAALRLAGTRAWLQIVSSVVPEAVVLDGNYNWLSPVSQGSFFDDADNGPGCDAPVFTKIKADLQCLSVAAASVLAKVERDALMAELAQSHPQFGWSANKGYATATHREAISVHGASSYHRTSWRLTVPEDVDVLPVPESTPDPVRG